MQGPTPLRQELGKSRLSRTLLYGLLTLFFLQLLSDFVAALYARGLLGTTIPVEIVAVLLLFTPILLLFAPGRAGIRGQAILVVLILLTAVSEMWAGARGRVLLAGLGTGSFMLLLPMGLFDRSQRPKDAHWAQRILGLSLGLALSICLRVWNSGVDPALQTSYRLIEVALAIMTGCLYWRASSQSPSSPARVTALRAPFGTTASLALGVVAALTMLYFTFASPGVIVRWVGGDYRSILGLILLMLTLLALIAGFAPNWIARLPREVTALWNLAFVSALVATLLAYQIQFPADPAAYPMPEPPAPAWSAIALFCLCILFPVILVDLSLYSDELIARRPTLRALGGGFALAALFLLLMIFAQTFTTVYDYIPVVGPLFRDRFWLVFLILGLALMAPLLSIRRDTSSVERAPAKTAAGLVTLVCVLAFLGALWRSATRPGPLPAGSRLRVLTYNIQQGYNAQGQWNYTGQLALLQQAKPDIVGLEESDSSRIAGGNSDLVRYFADHLGCYSYYGPKVVAGTFGIALLSRYPIENPRTVFFYSSGEQTAAIKAQVTVQGKAFNILVTHLGNDGPLVQQQELLREATGIAPVIAMGDFNFRPNSASYQLTRKVLDDAWLVRWPGGVDDQGYNPSDRIDHIFVSPGTSVKDAHFMTAPESDHPALWVDLGR